VASAAPLSSSQTEHYNQSLSVSNQPPLALHSGQYIRACQWQMPMADKKALPSVSYVLGQTFVYALEEKKTLVEECAEMAG
jgi:hypothetical protein